MQHRNQQLAEILALLEVIDKRMTIIESWVREWEAAWEAAEVMDDYGAIEVADKRRYH